ncbi:GIY-YIG nuclease family protein [Candidatus Parcubacteria bacterium]|uniref:Excinuclease ABC subunit C n=1 Tax=Candidatus Kaiserbacteria bacterium CG10_big_fil_rev_8_21_14_0_10_47_16 TaxID=1974608 RepID=A0A2H0UEC8_9BACT|nr:GIY-YIG nuclease family protein [Candidatus Parcubacteria bacterium]PIR84710.1 MAG: excinuclease ABC subunit C [Candidatus Kaiserbacteria bacterium CG10_big_fil_rev_8_21_14_0_10_47_16]
MSFYVYVLKSKQDNRFYTGCTNNLRKRFNQHNKGQVTATKKRLPVELIYYEMCHNQEDAYAREEYLKTGMGKRYIKNRLKGFLSLTG